MNNLMMDPSQNARNMFPNFGMMLSKEVQLQLARKREAMDLVGELIRAAEDVYSNVYTYTIYKVLVTTMEVEFLMNAFAAQGQMTPMIQANLQQQNQQYLSAMAMVPQHAMVMIGECINNIEVEPRHRGFIEEFKELLGRHLRK